MALFIYVAGMLPVVQVPGILRCGEGLRAQRRDPEYADPSLLRSQATRIQQQFRQGFQRAGWQANAEHFAVFIIIIPG
jgi:hypothetical protein